MSIVEWIEQLVGVSMASDNEFIFLLLSAVLIVIAFSCALSMFIGIAFAIFKR